VTALDILAVARTTGILLEARGERLHVEAPPGTLTPELRRAMVQRKAELLDLLAAPITFVTLKGGLVLPVPAVRLALDLEQRGFRMSLDPDQQFQIEPTATLTEADLAAIRRWRLHLAAIIGYDADALEALQ
jgi:hypothetical protein